MTGEDVCVCGYPKSDHAIGNSCEAYWPWDMELGTPHKPDPQDPNVQAADSYIGWRDRPELATKGDIVRVMAQLAEIKDKLERITPMRGVPHRTSS